MEIKAAPSGVDVSDSTLVVGVLSDLTEIGGDGNTVAELDQQFLEVGRFEGKAGQILRLPHDEAAALLLVGLGDEATFDSVRSAVGNAARAIKTEKAVTTIHDVGVDGATRAVVEGAALGGYEFRDYKTEGDGLDLSTLLLIGADDGEVAEALIAAEATNKARDWVNTPALDKAPQEFADSIAAYAESSGLTVDVWDRDRIDAEKLGALLGVAAGSDREPKLVILEYRPDGADQHLGLVGKGIIFDTGGLSLKTAAFMEEMKDDMSGAAIVSAATAAIARRDLPVSVTTVVPLTDNAVNGTATRPGDVLRPVEGPSIEVLNTDAEGRLILADGLGVVQRYEPDVIVDVATLTGAARVSLGDKIGAVFASEPDLGEKVLEAASRAGEHFWEMPLFDEYKKSLESDIADIKNISGGRYGGAIVAALFLSHYSGDGPWAHLDIAGPARSRETAGTSVKGASGVGVRTLVELARGMAGAD